MWIKIHVTNSPELINLDKVDGIDILGSLISNPKVRIHTCTGRTITPDESFKDIERMIKECNLLHIVKKKQAIKRR